jgi:hypothetical protein
MKSKNYTFSNCWSGEGYVIRDHKGDEIATTRNLDVAMLIADLLNAPQPVISRRDISITDPRG